MTTSGLCAHMFSGHSTIIILTGSPVPQLLGPWVCCWGLHPGIARGPTSHRKNRKTPQDGNNKDSGVGFLQFFGLDSFGFFWPPLKWPNLVGIGNALVDPKCCVRWNAILRGPKPESIYFLAPKLLSLVAVRVAKLFSYFTLGLRLKKTKALCFLGSPKLSDPNQSFVETFGSWHENAWMDPRVHPSTTYPLGKSN